MNSEHEINPAPMLQSDEAKSEAVEIEDAGGTGEAADRAKVGKPFFIEQYLRQN